MSPKRKEYARAKIIVRDAIRLNGMRLQRFGARDINKAARALMDYDRNQVDAGLTKLHRKTIGLHVVRS